jgi:lipoate---protein ligase
MKLLELTLPTPEENLALDEALLEGAEAGEIDGDVLRLWEMPRAAVVVGRSSRVAEEVDLGAAQADGVSVLRRASGGAAIVAGPGCLMYSVVLRYAGREHLRMLDRVHAHMLGIVRSALVEFVPDVVHLGTSDLAVAGRKISGNSVRCKHDHLLYHGTLLYGFDLGLIGRYLRSPPRQPEYRAGRGHDAFVMNVPVGGAEMRRAMARAFEASAVVMNWPKRRVVGLVAAKYGLESWNLER